MFKKIIIIFIAIFFVGAINLAAQTKTDTKLPDTPAGKRADAMLKAIAQADEATVRKFIEENGSKGMRSLPIQKHLEVFQGMKYDLEGMVITDVNNPEPDYIEITMTVRGGGLKQLDIQLTAAPDYLIDGIGFSSKKTSAEQSPFSNKPDVVSPGVVNAENRAMIIESTLLQFNDLYVFPEVAKEMEKAVRQRMQRKEYDNITSAEAFAKKLTADLQAVSRDKHVEVRYSDKPLPSSGNQQDLTPAQRDALQLKWKRSNHGFAKVEHLSGNIGYFKLRSFHFVKYGAEKVAATMNLLADTDALIIDLRDNTGGTPEMVALIASYMMGPEPVLFDTVHLRRGNNTIESWTLKDVPGKRYTGKNVYILTNKSTSSAGEAFAYNLKALKRATIVGETTGGLANLSDWVPISQHFELSVPIGNTINPITKTSWEGVGVKPDVDVPAEMALKTAHVAALKQILEKTADESYKADLKKIIETAEKELKEMKN
ncbi:MAG TPA: S41 family peptidase [Pyrinomonadaceae bacterium]|jgi:C-terminal processing protease CtpA/Prc